MIWSFRNWAFSTLSSTSFKKDSGSLHNKSFESLSVFQTFHHICSSCWNAPKEIHPFKKEKLLKSLLIRIGGKTCCFYYARKNNCSFPRSFSKDTWAHSTQLSLFFLIVFFCLFLFLTLRQNCPLDISARDIWIWLYCIFYLRHICGNYESHEVVKRKVE